MKPGLLCGIVLVAGCHHPGAAVTAAEERGVSDARCDRLSPAKSLITTPYSAYAEGEAAQIRALFSRARELMGKDVATGEELFMVMVKEDPRRPQEAVYLLRTPPRPGPREYRVVHARAKEQIQLQDSGIDAEATEAPVDAEMAHALEQSWGVMALAARWPDRKGSIARMKWPGIFYTFDYRGDNVYGQGDTVSPSAGTCSAALVNLGELLARYADAQDETKRRAIREELLRQSRALGMRLEAHTP